MKLFTIGHSNHSIETFITLLQKHNITAVADVRSHPYSKYLPHFNQTLLKKSLIKVGINYVFLGSELGARANNLKCYVDGKAIYEKIASTEEFREGIERILKGVKNHHIALMCAEKDPLTCHRAILICPYLQVDDLEINHILKDGDLECHNHLEERLLALHNLKQPQQMQLFLFDNLLSSQSLMNNYSREESLQKAYKLQGESIAYVEKKQQEDE